MHSCARWCKVASIPCCCSTYVHDECQGLFSWQALAALHQKCPLQHGWERHVSALSTCDLVPCSIILLQPDIATSKRFQTGQCCLMLIALSNCACALAQVLSAWSMVGELTGSVKTKEDAWQSACDATADQPWIFDLTADTQGGLYIVQFINGL